MQVARPRLGGFRQKLIALRYSGLQQNWRARPLVDTQISAGQGGARPANFAATQSTCGSQRHLDNTRNCTAFNARWGGLCYFIIMSSLPNCVTILKICVVLKFDFDFD